MDLTAKNQEPTTTSLHSEVRPLERMLGTVRKIASTVFKFSAEVPGRRDLLRGWEEVAGHPSQQPLDLGGWFHLKLLMMVFFSVFFSPKKCCGSKNGGQQLLPHFYGGEVSPFFFLGGGGR